MNYLMKYFLCLFLALQNGWAQDIKIESSSLFFDKNYKDKMTINKIKSFDGPLAHEGAVYIPEEKSLFFVSNRIKVKNIEETNNQKIFLQKLRMNGKKIDYEVFDPESGHMPMLNSLMRATQWEGETQKKALWALSQGDFKHRAGIYLYDLEQGKAKLILDQHNDLPFNSPNDLVLDKKGHIWFTDPIYGFEQNFRQVPKMPSSLWFFNTKTKKTTSLYSKILKPNGIALSLDEKFLVVADSSFYFGDGTHNPRGKRELLKFEIFWDGAYPRLKDPVVISKFNKGIPDGVKVDPLNNIWVAYGSGMRILNFEGKTLGEIRIPQGIVNHTFHIESDGTILAYLLAETDIYRVTLKNFRNK